MKRILTISILKQHQHLQMIPQYLLSTLAMKTPEQVALGLDLHQWQRQQLLLTAGSTRLRASNG